MEQAFANIGKTVRQLVGSNNALTLLSSAVEKFLDRTHGDTWDEGIRAEAEARANLLKRRHEIMLDTHRRREELEPGERMKLARELWRIAKDLDVRAQDVAGVVALHLQNKDAGSALDVIEEVHRDGVEVTGELRGLFAQMVNRCRQMAEEEADVALLERANRVAELAAN